MLRRMFWATRLMVAGGVIALPACGRPARDPQATAQPGLASLARANLSPADRAAWRQHLHWSDGCEQAFQASRAGTDGGLTFTSMGDGVSLVEVMCAAGSYQPSVVRLRLVESDGRAQVTPLVFPVYQSEDGQQVTMTRETEVWGESSAQGTEQALVILTLARQTGDCGVWTRYSLADAEPRITRAAARLDCPTPSADPVGFSPTEPPSGWAPIPRKD